MKEAKSAKDSSSTIVSTNAIARTTKLLFNSSSNSVASSSTICSTTI